jgi:hypothetical protein
MKMGYVYRVLTLTVVTAALAIPSVETAMAAPKQITKAHQPTGKTKASAFAPRPTKQRVFGAPIQPPIVHSPPPKKPR